MTVSKVDKPELMLLQNPKYEELKRKYQHLVRMDDEGSKPLLPVHLLLGASEYAKIKTVTPPTALGWTIMSPGHEDSTIPMLLTHSANLDYEQLCRLDVLGLFDSS